MTQNISYINKIKTILPQMVEWFNLFSTIYLIATFITSFDYRRPAIYAYFISTFLDIIINQRYLIPDINNIIKVISRYIRTTPVSGCKKVRIVGIATTIKTLNKKINSSSAVGLLYVLWKFFIIPLIVKINIIFINSLG
jgi:hypothetical protein